MCMIKAEVSEEFRQIERIKAGEWKSFDDDDNGGDDERGGHRLGWEGKGASSTLVGVTRHSSENPWAPEANAESNHGLRAGQQVPKGIIPAGRTSTSSSLADSLCGGSYSTCRRQNSSLCSSNISSLEEDHQCGMHYMDSNLF